LNINRRLYRRRVIRHAIANRAEVFDVHRAVDRIQPLGQLGAGGPFGNPALLDDQLVGGVDGCGVG
jgi:hypothetical protein